MRAARLGARAAQALTGQLNSMSSGVQTLRAGADADIGTAVGQVNTLINSIAADNTEISRIRGLNQSTEAARRTSGTI